MAKRARRSIENHKLQRRKLPRRAAALCTEQLETRHLLSVSAVLEPTNEVINEAPINDTLKSYELVKTIDKHTQVYEINGQQFTLISEPTIDFDHAEDEIADGHIDGSDTHHSDHAHSDAHHSDHTDGHFHGTDELKFLAADVGDELTASGVPLLHSLPDAPAKIFLDFDGNFEPSWGGNVNVTTPKYDIDDNPDSFSAEERDRIIEVWQRVSEDFSPFNIDVTTEDPSASATTLNQVRGGSDRIRTFYFRHEFNVDDASAVSALQVNLLRDDGAAVYLNGVEVVRDNLPENAAFDDLALSGTSGDDEDRYWPFDIDASQLRDGSNVIAVEVHQRNDTSSDVSFDLSLTGTTNAQSSTFVPKATTWRYLDDGSNQGTNWRNRTFNDAAWPTGNGQLGYGEDDEQTELEVYTAGIPRIRTYYFRKEFTVTDPDSLSNVALNLLRDDGAAVYLNGQEIRRDNLDANAAFDSFAQSSVNGNDEGRFIRSTVNVNDLVAGRNVLAVEVHQHSDTSSDVAFDLELSAISGESRIDLVSQGDQWHYLDDGSDQGTAWQASDFNDASWNTGIAQFGYGDVETGTSHIAIGSEDWFEGGAGGVAFVNAFEPDGRTVAYVFTNGAGNGAKNIAEATTHEAGHTFGLGHQNTYDPITGEKIEEYNPGSGDWAPHMGVGYSRPLTTWHNGPSGSVTNRTDEMERIARASNGFGFRDDDHGANPASATALLDGEVPVSQFTVSGIIERNSDIDSFSFSINQDGGGISVELIGADVGTNLNAVLEIRNSSGSVVATADPDNSYGASLATSLPLGDYTLSVRNNGEYGRVGQYTLVGEVDEDNDDLVPNNFGRLAPLGSLITRSTGNTAKINFAHDVDVFSTQLAPGQTISAIITPSNPTSALEAGWTGMPTTSGGIGLPVVVPIVDFDSSANPKLQVTGAVPTDYSVEFVINAAIESVGNTAANSTDLSLSNLNTLDSRLAVVANSGDGSDATFTMIPTESSWRYLDDGSNQGSAWRSAGFDDSDWPIGNGQLGYGDGDESTVVSELNTDGDRIRTFYFRHEFNVSDAAAIDNLLLSLIRDDGAAVYLNGTEVLRDNLAAGARNTTFADRVDNEDEYITALVPANLLVSGTNILAAEVHQESDTSSDVSFELMLEANLPTTSEVRLLNDGASWRYLDNGTNQETAWRDTDFNDTFWPQGVAEFGYGDNDEQTELDEDNRNGNRIRTYYFRREIEISDPDEFESVILDVIYDDGLAVYVNGVEYVRDLLPADAEFDDWALDDVSNEREFKTFVVPAEAFVAGRNVIAVEVHQESETSSDVSFDMEIRAEQKSADVDSYEFVIEQSDVGSPFSVYLAGIHADFSDETLQLIGPTGSVLATADVSDGDNSDLAISDFVANQPGTYKIQLKSFARGDYGIMVTNGLVYENETLTGSSISVGQLAFGHLASGAAMDLSDQFSVPLQAGQSVAILTRTPTTDSANIPNDLDIEVKVYSDDGSLVANDTDSGADGNAFLVFTATEPGTYAVDVLAESGEGEYTLRIALPGDANLDGAVDALDWNIWNANKFQSATDWGRADFNGDGVTDGSDFNIWSENRFSAAIARLNPARQPQAAPVADRNESGAPAAHDVAVEALTIEPFAQRRSHKLHRSSSDGIARRSTARPETAQKHAIDLVFENLLSDNTPEFRTNSKLILG